MSPRPPRVSPPGRWVDLAQRVGSAMVILVLGTGLLLAPRWWSSVGLAILFGALIWELARLSAPSTVPLGEQFPEPRPRPGDARMAYLVALLAALVMAGTLLVSAWCALGFLVPLVLGLRIADPPLRPAFVGNAVLMALATAGLAWVRATHGQGTAWWIVILVVVSDVLGYLVGRSVGGPKFWPAISPKKTWSGTVAGWVGAVALGLALVAAGEAGWGALVAGPLLVFGGQMGDIAESWLKRRAQVKDSSQLIPGHGGLMDRFDAMGGSLAAALVMGLAGLLPTIGS